MERPAGARQVCALLRAATLRILSLLVESFCLALYEAELLRNRSTNELIQLIQLNDICENAA